VSYLVYLAQSIAVQNEKQNYLLIAAIASIEPWYFASEVLAILPHNVLSFIANLHGLQCLDKILSISLKT